ncbi:MAG: hypothetical protein NT069_22070 [Planctomycetota bacterium]|nr:hypothetical protein [Planctomycetota bacterium]
MILDALEGAAKARQIDAYLRQHHTDLQRMMKRMADFAQSQMAGEFPGGTGVPASGATAGLTYPAIGTHGSGTWTGGSSKTVTIYTGAGGSESATALTVSAYLPAGLTISSGGLCILDQVYGGTVYAHPHSC